MERSGANLKANRGCPQDRPKPQFLAGVQQPQEFMGPTPHSAHTESQRVDPPIQDAAALSLGSRTLFAWA